MWFRTNHSRKMPIATATTLPKLNLEIPSVVIGREVSSWKGQLVGYNLGLTMRPTPARQH